MTRSLSRSTAIAGGSAIAVLLGGCAADPEEAAERAATVAVLDTDLGEVLVDGMGSVLYVFEPDAAEAVSCTFTCATNWPPLTAVDGEQVRASAGVDGDLLATLANPMGGDVITYDGWPLYRYAADRTPGDHVGQGRYLNGGDWYVMTPSGEPLVP